jgi:hypothetical protein
MSKIHDYQGIPRETVERFRAELAKEGIAVPLGDSGTIEHRGVRLSFSYEPMARTLRVTLDKKPPFITENYVWSLIDGAIGSKANV